MKFHSGQMIYLCNLTNLKVGYMQIAKAMPIDRLLGYYKLSAPTTFRMSSFAKTVKHCTG